MIYNFCFHELLEKDNSVNIHQRNMKSLAVVLIKVKNNLAAEFMNDAFKLKGRSYNNINNLDFQRRNKKAVFYESETLNSLELQILGLIKLINKKLSQLEIR